MKVSQMRLREQCSKYVFSYKLCNNHINVLYPRLCGRWPMLVLANYCITHAEWEVGRQRLSYANQEPTERGNATPPYSVGRPAGTRWPLPAPSWTGPRLLHPNQRVLETLQVKIHLALIRRFSHGQPWAPTGTPRNFLIVKHSSARLKRPRGPIAQVHT